MFNPHLAALTGVSSTRCSNWGLLTVSFALVCPSQTGFTGYFIGDVIVGVCRLSEADGDPVRCDWRTEWGCFAWLPRSCVFGYFLYEKKKNFISRTMLNNIQFVADWNQSISAELCRTVVNLDCCSIVDIRASVCILWVLWHSRWLSGWPIVFSHFKKKEKGWMSQLCVTAVKVRPITKSEMTWEKSPSLTVYLTHSGLTHVLSQGS